MELPEIMTAKTYYWRPASNASGRRSNEKRRSQEVQAFLDAHRTELERAGIEVYFSYSESCHNVYKHVEVYEHGVKKDIRALKKALGIK